MTCPYCAAPSHVMSTEAGPGPLCGDQAATGSPATPGRRQDAELSDNAQVKAVGGGATSEKLTPPPSLLLIEPGPGVVEASQPGICERSPERGSGSISSSEPIEARR